MSKLPETITLAGPIDIHNHIREPSPLNNAEDYDSGTIAAALGAFTAVYIMPNTEGMPTITTERARQKRRLGLEKGYIPTGVIGGVDPETGDPSEIERMIKLWQIAMIKFYDDKTTGNEKSWGAAAFRPFVEAIHQLDPTMPIMLHHHPENLEDMIGMIAGDFKQPLHVCHMNDASEVKLISQYKRRFWPVTCGVTPNHLFMDEDDLFRWGWLAKCKPDIKPQESEKLMYQLENGDIDAYETDHAPHPIHHKMFVAENDRKYGIPNVRVAIPLLLGHWIMNGLDMRRFEDITAFIPRRIARAKRHPKTEVTISLEEYQITAADAVSKTRYSPYIGKKAVGRVIENRIAGTAVVLNGEVIGKKPRVLVKGSTI